MLTENVLKFSSTKALHQPGIVKQKLGPDTNKLDYIDSLRGVAILMVILVHISQKVPGLNEFSKQIAAYGQMGVQLFFVLSAYTLCLSIDRRKNEKKKLLAFYIRRYFRIAPMYYLGIVIYFVVGLILFVAFKDDSNIRNYTLMNVMSNVFFFHNFYPPAINNIVPGGWSIGAEMAFYSVFPFLFFQIKKMSDKKKFIFSIPFAGLILSLIFFASLTYIMKGRARVENDNVLYYNLINQFPVFLLGIAYYFYEGHSTKKNSFPAFASILLFVITTVGAIYFFYNNLNFTFIPFLSGVSFVFLIDVFKQHRLLNIRLLRRVGQLSFSMYVLHFLFAYYGTEYLVSMLNNKRWMPEMNMLFSYLLSIIMTFALALVTEKFIERKGTKLGKYIIEKF